MTILRKFFNDLVFAMPAGIVCLGNIAASITDEPMATQFRLIQLFP